MSWDTSYRRVKCPCGKGEVVQEIREDDWNRVEEGKPVIQCPECAERYKLITKRFPSYKPLRGDVVNHFLVPKDFEFNNELKDSYGSVSWWELAKKDFSEYLVVEFSKDSLLNAYDDVKGSSSVSSLRGFAKEIAKDKRRYTGSCKIRELEALIERSIEMYDSYIGNYEQRLKEKRENDRLRKENYEQLKREGILLDL